LKENLEQMEFYHNQIVDLFKSEGIENFNSIPESKEARRKFVSLFNKFNKYLAAARIQGFRFDDNDHNMQLLEKAKTEDVIIKDETQENVRCNSELVFSSSFITGAEYTAFKQRYNEISKSPENEHSDAPYDIQGYLTELDSVKINNDYMNSKFQKYIKALYQSNIDEEELNDALKTLHKSFATLSQEQQKFANILMHDIDSGNIEIEEGKTFMDYITEYQYRAENDQISKLCSAFGIDKSKLKKVMNAQHDDDKITDVGGYEDLKRSIDVNLAKKYFEYATGREYDLFEVNLDAYDMLYKFILVGGFDI
jgi:type I restriction enzyme R subunit